MAGMRAGRIKGPWVGTNGVPAPLAGLVYISATDTAPGYLEDKLESSVGLSPDVKNAGGVEVLSIETLGGFCDDLKNLRPFWMASDAILNADWQYNLVGQRLDGIAENAATQLIRDGIEGNFDYAMHLTVAALKTAGFTVENSSTIGILTTDGTQITVGFTGQPAYNYPLVATNLWLRMKRQGSINTFFYRLADTDPWTQIRQYTTGVDWYHSQLKLYSGIGNTVEAVRLFDNTFPERMRGDVGLTMPAYEYIANNYSVNAAYANIFDITMTADTTVANPTNAMDGQKIMFRIRQDGTGGWAVTWDTAYRFSTDLPLPTLAVAPNALSYIGFIYNRTDGKWDCIALNRGF